MMYVDEVDTDGDLERGGDDDNELEVDSLKKQILIILVC